MGTIIILILLLGFDRPASEAPGDMELRVGPVPGAVEVAPAEVEVAE